MKKMMLVTLAITALTSGLVFAQEDKLGVTLDLTYASRYIWRGVDVFANNHSALQPSVDFDLWGTGFGINIWASMANGGGSYVNQEEWDYTLYYGNTFFEAEKYQTDYTVGYVYYNYPDGGVRNAVTGKIQDQDAQEVFVSLAFPKVCSFGVVPSYTFVHMWPSESGRDSTTGTANSAFRQSGGSIHVLGLDYSMNIDGLLPEIDPQQSLDFSFATVYNDSMLGRNVDHDWSHAVFGVATTFDISPNMGFTPALYYQSSWDDSVNTSDEYWTTLSLSYKF